MAKYGHGATVQEFPLSDWAPDLAYDAGNGKAVILIDMDNASPTNKGYQALNSLEPYSEPPSVATGTPAPEEVLGSTVGYFSSATPKIYFGGPFQLWRLDGNGWTSIGHTFEQQGLKTNPPSLQTFQNVNKSVKPTTQRWRFSQFGDDIVAVNRGGGWLEGGAGGTQDPVIAPQVARGATGRFTILGGGSYTAGYDAALGYPPTNVTTAVAVNGQLLMFWGSNWSASALGRDDQWLPDIQTQAGSGPLYDFPGDIVAAAAIFRTVVVFKQTAMWLFTYAGGTAVWSNQLLSSYTGTWCQESVVTLPDSIVFVGADDFYQCSGWSPQRLKNSVKEWFFDTADPLHFDKMLSRFDSTHAVVYWYFVSKTAPTFAVPDRYVAWNQRTGKWATGYIAELGAYSIPVPNEQPSILSGLIFTADKVLRSWTGAPGAARYETGYFGAPGTSSQCMRARPIYYVAPDGATMMPLHARNLGDPAIKGPTAFLNQRDGWYYFRQYDNWHRFQLITVGPNVKPTTVSQTGAEVSAIAIELRPGGWR